MQHALNYVSNAFEKKISPTRNKCVPKFQVLIDFFYNVVQLKLHQILTNVIIEIKIGKYDHLLLEH